MKLSNFISRFFRRLHLAIDLKQSPYYTLKYQSQLNAVDSRVNQVSPAGPQNIPPARDFLFRKTSSDSLGTRHCLWSF